MPVLLNTAYFPPVEYFAVMVKDLSGTVHVAREDISGNRGRVPEEGGMHAAGPAGKDTGGCPEAFSGTPSRLSRQKVYIEACENYQKQSYRNRCHFYSAAGLDSLSFPIVHTGGSHNNIPIKEVLVDYSVDWVTRHKRAIVSAYRMSAYFEYYSDALFAILDSRPDTLFRLNRLITEFFISRFGLPVELSETSVFSPRGSSVYGTDYREAIHPKRPDNILRSLGLEKPYFQVFSGKYGFIPHLSAMDLLFNEGPESIAYLCPAPSTLLPQGSCNV